MSKFTNYESTAATSYDVTRIPVGIEVYSGMIEKFSPNKLKDSKLLDLGAGTGSYPKLLLDDGLKHATLLDVSDKMLNQSKEKMAAANYTEESGRVKFQKNMLPGIPFEEGSYDVVACTMVIHHLVQATKDDSPGNVNGLKVKDWSPIVETLKNAAKVLKPKGLLLIGYSTPQQRGGNWYADLVPEAKAKTTVRCPSGKQVIDFCNQAGFEVVSEMSMMTHYTGYEVYNDEEIFLKNEGAWMMDSVLSSASEEELARAKEWVREMKAAGTLREFYEKHDDIPDYGCGRILAAVKK